jgi:Cu+-exporting ATPase
MTYKKIIFKISGMHCTSCAMNIDGELEDTGKVKDVRTNYAKSETSVEFDPQKITEKQIIELIRKTGYEAKPIQESSKH